MRGELDKLALRGSSNTSATEHSIAANTTTNNTTTTLHTSDTILCSAGDIVNNESSLDAMMINQSSSANQGGCRDAGGGGGLRSRDLTVLGGAAAPRDTLLEAPTSVTGSHSLLQHRDMGGRIQDRNLQESRNFTLSPETTDCDSADLESELSLPGIYLSIYPSKF